MGRLRSAWARLLHLYGPPDHPMSVVDTQGRVKGVQSLRVVDASVFPGVPCANTNFPTIMTAEKNIGGDDGTMTSRRNTEGQVRA